MVSKHETLRQDIARYENFLSFVDDQSTREVLFRLMAESKKQLAHVEASGHSSGRTG
jgi:hypothetical protein